MKVWIERDVTPKALRPMYRAHTSSDESNVDSRALAITVITGMHESIKMVHGDWWSTVDGAIRSLVRKIAEERVLASVMIQEAFIDSKDPDR